MIQHKLCRFRLLTRLSQQQRQYREQLIAERSRLAGEINEYAGNFESSLNNLGIDEYTSPKEAHDAVQNVADNVVGEMSEGDENMDPKEKIADILHGIGEGNLKAFGGVPAAMLIGGLLAGTVGSPFVAGLAISWGATALLMGLAKLLEKEPGSSNESLNESMIGGIVGIGAINQIPPRAKADYETAFEHFLGGKYGLNEEMEVMVDSNMLKSYFNELISLADDMEYTPEMVDELKNLKNTLQGGKISVENALDLMQQTVDITEDDIDAVEALSQAVDNDDAIIDKAREIYGLDEGKEVKIEEGKEEVVLSNEILNFLEERGIIDPSDAQKVHTDLTSFLEDKIKPEKSSQEKNYDPQYSQDPRERYDSGGSQPGH